MPIYLPAPQHNPTGPDGRGWNRMAIHGMCHDECALRPMTLEKFLEAQDTRRAAYGGYGSCFNEGQCATCSKFLEPAEEWSFLGDEIVVREHEVTREPWVMNRPDDGWGEYGKPVTWERLMRIEPAIPDRYRDEHGRGLLLRKP